MGEILTVLSGHTEDHSSSSITQVEHNPTDSTSLNSKSEKAWAHDNLRTTNQVKSNDSCQQSNSHNTNVSSSVAQNVANEDILPNCTEDSSQSQATVPAADHKEAEHIAHVLQAIGDQLNTSATDHLSEEIVEALRSIGDRIDAKIGPHNQVCCFSLYWNVFYLL